MQLLNQSNFANNPKANPPNYAMSDVRIGVLHMGLGAFHRAHQAVFFENVLRSGNLNYGVCSVSQRSSTVADSLAAQDGFYTVNAQDGSHSEPMIIGAIRETAFYERDLARLLEIAKSPDLRLITLTVSEKAYRNGDASHLPHRIATLLAARYAAGLPGLAVISCDNLPSNGEVTRRVVLEAITEPPVGFVDWVKTQVRFPNSMIDRIVPAITQASIDKFAEEFGYLDKSLITTEFWNEWIIENDPLEAELSCAGVRFVEKVAPYELAKIRMFNGNHSTLAYISQLAGIEYVADAIVDPVIAPFILKLQELELGRSFTPPADLDPIAYAGVVRTRVSNPTLLHRSQQIAMDGSQKLPQRLFGAANDLLARNLPATRICFAIAVWLHYLATSDKVSDPLASALLPLAQLSDPLEAVKQSLSLPQFASTVDAQHFPTIAHSLKQLREKDVKAAIQDLEGGAV